jgi:hypothetical protein
LCLETEAYVNPCTYATLTNSVHKPGSIRRLGQQLFHRRIELA